MPAHRDRRGEAAARGPRGRRDGVLPAPSGASQAAAEPPLGWARVVAVHSYRGGTGKTNLVANLGANLARRGARVAIIDADVQSPGLHVLFGLDAADGARCINHYLWGSCAIVETVRNVSAAVGAEGEAYLYLVPASMRPGEIARLLRHGYDVLRLTQGLKDLIDWLELDYVLIDTHPGLEEETLLAIAVADVLLLMLRPDRQDFQGTAVTVDVARRLEVPRLLLAVNHVPSGLDLDDLRGQLERTYEAPVAAMLPLTEELVRLGSGGLFTLTHPDHPWSQGVGQIAARVAD